MNKHWIISIVVSVWILPLSLHAGMFGWFGKKNGGESAETSATNTIKRLHLKISDKAAEKELLQMSEVKRTLFQERQVLLLLAEEKRRDLDNFDAAFAKSFGVMKDRNYRYDAKTMALYEEVNKGSTTTNTAGTNTGETKFVKKLKSESESRKFTSLAAAKQLIQEDLIVLARLIQEKEAALARVDNAFKEKFSMSRERNYWYDVTTMQLYEIVNPSSKGGVQ